MFGGGKHTEEGGEGVPGGDNRSGKEGLNKTQEFVNRFSASFRGGIYNFTRASAQTVRQFKEGIGKVAGPLKKYIGAAGVLYAASNVWVGARQKTRTDVATRDRTLRGLNIDYGQMAKAIRIGQTYGIGMNRMLQSTAQMQGQLLQATWGRGDMITKLGEWGLSPYKEDGYGQVKTPHELRLSISRKAQELNATGGQQLVAQFLNAIGIASDEWRMYMNYEKESKKANFHIDDTLEKILGKVDEVTQFSELTDAKKAEREQIREIWKVESLWSFLNPKYWSMFDNFAAESYARDQVEADKGIEKVQKILGVENIYSTKNTPLVYHLEQAIRAEVVFKRDKDYVVKDDEVLIVDEFTGRIMPGRR